MEDKEQLADLASTADSIVKILCAIMNEEDDVDAYQDKTRDEMQEIFESINNRFPNNYKASLDPAYIRFGQACMNGYETFGIDFLKQLTKRNDQTISLCIKGLIDLYTNMLIQNQYLSLQLLPEEERVKYEKDLVNAEDMSDEEFKESLKEEQ